MSKPHPKMPVSLKSIAVSPIATRTTELANKNLHQQHCRRYCKYTHNFLQSYLNQATSNDRKEQSIRFENPPLSSPSAATSSKVNQSYRKTHTCRWSIIHSYVTVTAALFVQHSLSTTHTWSHPIPSFPLSHLQHKWPTSTHLHNNHTSTPNHN